MTDRKVVISYEEYRGGAPLEAREGVRDLKLIYPETGFDPKTLIMEIVEVPPDDHTPLHRHSCEEVYYVLQGEGYVEVEGTEHEFTAGDAVFNRENEAHRVVNTGDEDIRLVVVAGIMLQGLLPEWPTERPYEILEE
jgi:quercetin dioxygenase-like cupin family protein